MNRIELERADFEGFISFSDLRASSYSQVPFDQGVYFVLHYESGCCSLPTFLQEGTGHWFKGKNPNVSVDTLSENWIMNTDTLYIGKASSGARGKRGLKKRISELLRFGVSERVGHWGGRYLWQIPKAEKLQICWKATLDDPALLESKMIADFSERYSARPFANLRN